GCSTSAPEAVVDDATEAAQSVSAVDDGQLPSWVDGILTTAAASLSSVEVTVPTADGEVQEVAQPALPDSPVDSAPPSDSTPEPDGDWQDWESDGGYVSRAEAEEAAVGNECPIGERNLSPDGLDCQPLSVSFEKHSGMDDRGGEYSEPEEYHGPDIDEWTEADEEAYWEEYGQMKEEMYGPVDPDNPDAPAQPVDDELY
ncbi:MAG TPA: hypothetical protein H9871_05600, partial [Candidatus Nesterenkonia stercoripullorum]|nr:hypothetical protein [Candidatus Nesterenkonia stercoripullorum]